MKRQVALTKGMRAIVVDGRSYPLIVERDAVDHFSITVHPELRVTVRVPPDASDEVLFNRVLRRRVWIRRQILRFAEYQPLPVEHRFHNGETHLYLGRQIRLRIRTARQESVTLHRGFLDVHLPAGRHLTAKELVSNWFEQRARMVLRRRLQLCLPVWLLRLDLEPRLRVTRMAKRWGSCSKRGLITLNQELIHVPTPCIDYVIVHELCHLREPNHGPRFWRLLQNTMPDWERRKARLEKALL